MSSTWLQIQTRPPPPFSWAPIFPFSPTNQHQIPKQPTKQVSHLTAYSIVKEKSVESMSRGHPLVTLGRFVYIRTQRRQSVLRGFRYYISSKRCYAWKKKLLFAIFLYLKKNYQPFNLWLYIFFSSIICYKHNDCRYGLTDFMFLCNYKMIMRSIP